MEQLSAQITTACRELFGIAAEPTLTRPDEQFGDFATNVALQLAKQLSKNPREIAEAITAKLQNVPEIAAANVAGPGFINLTLSNGALLALLEMPPPERYKGKTIVVEYSDPNPFKVLHAGHLYTSVVGDAIANLLDTAGASVHRVNFGGDVGLHVGKTMWAIMQKLGGEQPEKLADITEDTRTEWLTEAYIAGNNAYEENNEAKQQIIQLNKRVYQLFADNDHDSPFARIYWTTRDWSYQYFDAFYGLIGTKFEKYYPESETAPIGLATVQEQLAKGVYKESDGAVVFEGESYGLHTRVFINSEGLPTYETKDVGLIMKKWQDYHFDRSVVITGNDIVEYMRVVLKSVEQFAPELAAASVHLTHGIVKLEGGEKMSSRKGNILRAVDVLDAAAIASKAETDNDDPAVVLGAVKYAFLKQRLGGDIIYNPEESVSISGNSGPYLQYALARANSIARKSSMKAGNLQGYELNVAERALVSKLGAYQETISKAIDELLPHHICTYLYELSQIFNRFYESNRVVGDDHEAERLRLVSEYVDVLRHGLGVLNIPAPERL